MRKQKLKIKESERDIQKQILEWLSYQKNIYFIRNNTGSFKITRQNGTQGWCHSSKKGSPDILLCKDGHFYGLEIKTQQGRQSEAQKQAEIEIKKAGGNYFIIRDLETLITILWN